MTFDYVVILILVVALFVMWHLWRARMDRIASNELAWQCYQTGFNDGKCLGTAAHIPPDIHKEQYFLGLEAGKKQREFLAEIANITKA